MSIFFSDEQDQKVDGDGLVDFARQVLEAEGLPAATEMALLLIGADQIADYNDRFMGRIGPTDVLAFPVEDLAPGSIPRLAPEDPPLNLGDVFVCPSEASRRAVENGFDPKDFLFLITVHGILHLLGYGHDDDTEAERMERREDELLRLIGRRV